MSEIADAVTGTIGDLFGDGSAVAEQTEDAQETVAAVQETEVELELPDWEAASRDLFQDDDDDEPDFTAVADDDVDVTDELAVSEYDDEDTQKLKRALLAERKRAEHFRSQHLKSSRKAWEADVRSQPWGEFLPEKLDIEATSHRDFVKKAKATAKANYTVLKPHLEKLTAERNRLTQLAKAEAQTEVQAAWGKPTVGGGHVADAASDSQQRLEGGLTEARRSRSIFKATKAMIEEGLI